MSRPPFSRSATWLVPFWAGFVALTLSPVSAQNIADLKSKAEAGDVQAESALGNAYHKGDGVEKDDAEAVRWWEKAAEQSDIGAQINLGIAYQFGWGVTKNYVAVGRWYQRAADQGNAGAESDLALLHHLGLGLPKDDAEAARWWQKAAEQGLAAAQINLGTAYHLGAGVPKDETQATGWYRKAAEKDDATGQLNLGMAYIYGNGVAKDEAEGVKWLRKSAEQGNPGAQFSLGFAYHSGTGIPKDDGESSRWYLKAAEQGVAAAQYNMGEAYAAGWGVEKDAAEAARWWNQAAQQGIAKAQYNLGLAYHNGTGVQKDDVEAYFWINIAASSLEQGFVRETRDRIGQSLTSAQLTDVQERCRKWAEAHQNTQFHSNSPSVGSATNPETGFISKSKYTNAFFGFSLPLPHDFSEYRMSLKFEEFGYFLFGLQTFTTASIGKTPNPKLSVFFVTAKKSANPEDLRKAATGPPGTTPTMIEIAGREFWTSEFEQKVSAGREHHVVFSTEAQGYILQFRIESFDKKITAKLRDSISHIDFFDPAIARSIAGPDSRPYPFP